MRSFVIRSDRLQGALVSAVSLVAALSLTVLSSSGLAEPVKLPPKSSAQVVTGEKLYQQHCAICHGANGKGAAPFPRPIWGKGADLAKFSTTRGLFEYMQMLMPFDDPSKINDEQKTAITAFITLMHGASKPEANLPKGGNDIALK